MIGLFTAFAIAMLITWLLTPHVRNLALHWNVVANPRDRDVHLKSTPRLGGIAIYLGVILAAALTITYRHYVTHGLNGWSWRMGGVIIASTFIAFVGMIDDVKDLKAQWQALGIILGGTILIAFGVRIDGFSNPFISHKPGVYLPQDWIALSPPISIIATLFWVFLVTKTVDAVDGLDGLAAGVCAISASTLAILAAISRQPEGPTIALLAASVVGACLGFLKFNYNPAKIFMGTVGAQFLGFTLAAISIMGTFKWAAAITVAVPILVLGVPIFDYGIVLVQRMMCHAPLTMADRRHFHHRLLDRGLSQKQAVWVIYGCTAVLCIFALVLFQVSR
jgi:UDP-GlcNAc:undecaprenyl-phosphate GlcNAc-1-phosphate transferase